MYMVDKRTQHVGQHSANMLHMLANMLRWFKPAFNVKIDICSSELENKKFLWLVYE